MHATRSPLLLALLACAALAACEQPPARANARQATSAADLLGGPRALGTIGDFVLENGEVRVVIQGPGLSRGFGIYGGSLIDAGIRPARDTGATPDIPPIDGFAELFPAFLLQATAVDEVVIVSDGSDGGAAIVEARGTSGNFLEIAGVINALALGNPFDSDTSDDAPAEERFLYTIRYELPPSARHVKITYLVENVSEQELPLPGQQATDLLPLIGLDNIEQFRIPFGDVVLFGNNNDVFLPGAGFDVRFGLERAYEEDVPFPGFPGLVLDYIAAEGEGVSYGLIAEASPDNFLMNVRELYGAQANQINDTAMLMPFVASGFLGVFHNAAPQTIGAGETLSATKYFIIGDGDIGDVLDEVHAIRGTAVGRIGGRVYDEATGAAATDAEVVVFRTEEVCRTEGSGEGSGALVCEEARVPFVQYEAHGSDALFEGTLPPGQYAARVTGEGRPASDFQAFEIREGDTTALRLVAPSAGRLVVHVTDPEGRRLPAKVTAVGRYAPENAGRVTRDFLFDLQLNEGYRSIDLVPDDPSDPDTLQYIEGTAFTHGGTATMLLRPGTYDIYTSRGMEYDYRVETVTITPGDTATVAHTIARVVDTEGWIAADTHLHSINSIDSGIDLETRVLAVAAEGVEWAIATDHNYVTDYEPTIWGLGLYEWMRGTVGVELTTQESGHFNGYPLNYDVGAVTHGAFATSLRPPGELFAMLRELGKYSPEETVVQVNHPRDSITGYFNQYDRDALTTEFNDELDLLDQLIFDQTGSVIDVFGPAFFEVGEDGRPVGATPDEWVTTYSSDFDALEVLNGKLFWSIHHFRDEEGRIVREDGEVTAPGAVDDWYNLLNLGQRYIAVGSSDSHGTGDEAGFFSTYVFTGEDDVRQVEERAFFQRMKERNVIATNGPFLRFWVNTPETPIGAEVVDTDGTVRVGIELTAAPWVSVTRINVVRNGVIAAVLGESDGLRSDRDYTAEPFSTELELPLATNDEGDPADAWFVVQALGEQNYFPLVAPVELPPLDLTSALGAVAEPLGLDVVGESTNGPSFVFPVTPFALTNPIWVRTEEGRGWQPPGVVPFEERTDPANDPGLDLNPVATSTLEVKRFDAPTPGYYTLREAAHHAPRPLFELPPVHRLDIRRTIQTFAHHH